MFDPLTSCPGCSDDDEVTIINFALLSVIKIVKDLGPIGDPLLAIINHNINGHGIFFGHYRDSLYVRAKVKVVPSYAFRCQNE